MFEADAYRDVRKPLLEASTLPPFCYTSEDFFRREIEHVFLPHWQFVGREEQLDAAGKYFCHEGVGGSVIVLRDADNGLRAYANSCRHRGARLMSGSGACKRIVCPYHSWAYRLDGSLANAPGMQAVEGFETGQFPLVELELQTWAGFVFVRYRAGGEDLAEHLGSMTSKFDGHGCERMQLVGDLEFEVDSNWKLLAENALEAYHTGSVHRETLGQQQARAVDTSGSWTGLLVEDENSVATLPGEDKPFPHIDGLDDEARSGAYFTLLYPSTQFVFAQDCMWWLNFEPLAVDRTRVTIGACFPRSTIELPGFEEKVKPYFDRWRRATAEDNAICEAQQQGQRLERPPGRFAASEFAVHALANWLLDQVLDQ